MPTKEKEFAYITGFSSNVYKTISAAEARISTTSTPRSYISAMLLILKSLLFFCLDIVVRTSTVMWQRTMSVCSQQRSSKVTWNYTWNLTLLNCPGNLHLTLHSHYTFHSMIKNFSACFNTLCGIELAASQADRLRSACSLAIMGDDYVTNLLTCLSWIENSTFLNV